MIFQTWCIEAFVTLFWRFMQKSYTLRRRILERGSWNSCPSTLSRSLLWVQMPTDIIQSTIQNYTIVLHQTQMSMDKIFVMSEWLWILAAALCRAKFLFSGMLPQWVPSYELCHVFLSWVDHWWNHWETTQRIRMVTLLEIRSSQKNWFRGWKGAIIHIWSGLVRSFTRDSSSCFFQILLCSDLKSLTKLPQNCRGMMNL